MGSSSQFSIHYRTKCQQGSHPICPKIKQIQCLSKLVCVLQYCLDKSWHKVLIFSSPFLFLIKYMILYLLKREISSLSKSPRKPLQLYIYQSLCSCRNYLNYILSKGAAGSFVQKYFLPYLLFKSFLFTFSIAIRQVHLSQLHAESICFVYRSQSQGKKQLAKASADSCLERLFSFQLLTTEMRKSLRRCILSSLSCPRVYSTSCDSKTDYERYGQASISLCIAQSVFMFFSWNTAWYRSPISSLGLMSCLQNTSD